MKFACPSVVLRDRETNSGATEPFQPWSQAGRKRKAAKEKSAVHRVWIEVLALNGPWSRKFQPGIPDTVETIVAEGVACARAGATIVHLHAYDGGGPQTYDWQVYASIIEGIRNQIDVPIYPSFSPFMLAEVNADVADPAVRFAHAEQLAARGLIEFAFADPGCMNFTQTRTTAKDDPAGSYLNPETHTRYAFDLAKRHGLHPDLAIYEPGFLRAGAALARAVGTEDADLPPDVLRNDGRRFSTAALWA